MTPSDQQPWNHNIHYHKVVLAALPASCRQALDVGCGEGLLTRQLAGQAAVVTGINMDRASLERAHALSGPAGNITFLDGDVMTYPFPSGSFDLIAAVAALHHLPLRPALERFRTLLAPGGVLAVIGLYRAAGVADHLYAAAGLPASRLLRLTRHLSEQTAPITEPRETLSSIRAAARDCLPGAVLERKLLFRYSLLWRKPSA